MKSSALLTDLYELTMIDAALESGTAERRSVFEVFTRRLPAGRRYGVVAGTGRILERLEQFRFGAAELEWLRTIGRLRPTTLEYLGDYRFTGDITGYGEGEVFFPGSPVLTVSGTFAEAVVLETMILSILNYDSAVAGAASRMTMAAHGRPCLEMGARRTHEEGAVAAARATAIAGFAGTSDLEAARSYGLKPIGTAAHSFTLLYDSEEEAFDAQIAALGTDTTLLVDTYNVQLGVERAVAAARRHGGELGAVRLDSGDLVSQAFIVRQQLDELGATSTKITVTSDLDEHSIASLGAAPVDTYGVGTKVVTGSGHPTAELVYKLVEREGATGEMVPVQKASESKVSLGGHKFAGRVIEGGVAAAELTLGTDDAALAATQLAEMHARPLQVELVKGGVAAAEHMGAAAVEAAATRHQSARAELPYEAWRLSEGEPAIPTRHLGLN